MKKSMKILIVAVLLLLAVAAVLFRWMEGETIYAKGYSSRNWELINNGMTKAGVVGILGQPLDYNVEWGSILGEEKWERFLWSRTK